METTSTIWCLQKVSMLLCTKLDCGSGSVWDTGSDSGPHHNRSSRFLATCAHVNALPLQFSLLCCVWVHLQRTRITTSIWTKTKVFVTCSTCRLCSWHLLAPKHYFAANGLTDLWKEYIQDYWNETVCAAVRDSRIYEYLLSPKKHFWLTRHLWSYGYETSFGFSRPHLGVKSLFGDRRISRYGFAKANVPCGLSLEDAVCENGMVAVKSHNFGNFTCAIEQELCLQRCCCRIVPDVIGLCWWGQKKFARFRSNTQPREPDKP